MTEVELLAVLIKKYGTPAPDGGLQVIVTDQDLMEIEGVVWQHFDHYTHRHFFFLKPPVIDVEVVEDLDHATIAIGP